MNLSDIMLSKMLAHGSSAVAHFRQVVEDDDNNRPLYWAYAPHGHELATPGWYVYKFMYDGKITYASPAPGNVDASATWTGRTGYAYAST